MRGSQKKEKIMLLKFLDKYNRGPYSEFDFSEYLPTKKTDGTWKPGKWLPKVGYLEMCERGYHATDKEHMLEWLNSNLYEIEARGTKIEGDDKIAFAQIRFVRKIETWNDKSARLFACWCARQVWHLMTDKRSRNAVEVAERHANGEATDEELAAAWAAAWDAARDAAWDAARAEINAALESMLYELLGVAP